MGEHLDQFVEIGDGDGGGGSGGGSQVLAEPGLVTATSGLLAGGEVVVGAAWLAALLLSCNLRVSLFFLLTEGGWNVGGELYGG